MAQDISGQNAVITGASRGIGRAAAIALAKIGVNVAVVARNANQLAETVAECEALGVKAEAFPADAVDTDAVKDLHKGVIDSFGKVDILVNNTGVGKYATLENTDVDDYDWMMNTNMRSTFLFSQAFVPAMKRQGSGIVVFVSSQAGVNGFPNETVYCATKHAQVGFATALDGEVRPHGVKVSIIAPGGVRTTFAFGKGREDGMSGLADMSEADTVADAIVFAAQADPKSRMLMIGMRPMSEPLYGGA